MPSHKEEKEEFVDAEDNRSVGGDSGFGTGDDDKREVAKKANEDTPGPTEEVKPDANQKDKENTQETQEEKNTAEEIPPQDDSQEANEIVDFVVLEPTTRDIEEQEAEESLELEEDNESTTGNNFLYRIASIPIIQDSCVGAQNIVRQHTIGQRALDFAETNLQPVLVSAYHTSIFSRANRLGNKSLDLLERQFPIISSPTQEILEPIKDRMDHAASLLKVPNEQVDRITHQFEKLLDYYLPSDQEKEKKIEEHGVQRLLAVSHILSDRITKKVMSKVSAGKEEEERVRALVLSWIGDKAKVMLKKQPVFVQDLIKEKTLQSEQLHKFTLEELEKVRQELSKQTSHMERAKSLWNLSRDDIILPLFEKTSSFFHHKQATAA
ncbi:hypothetical protein BY458DRAFT_498463 [Sporodiniella umbellata]|nr:hypothetical protein BY458DRAFT_498463 [Sporodiniella umbellata]